MTPPHDRVIAAGRFLRLVDRDGWEFAERPHGGRVVAVVAITDARSLLLVEQFRVPLGRAAIELPAGLVGDDPRAPDESDERAARRELLEETGHDARQWTRLLETPTSAGLTSELVTIFLARGLRRVSGSLGDGSERITLHEIPLESLDDWLDGRRAAGTAIDSKIHAGVYLAWRAERHPGG